MTDQKLDEAVRRLRHSSDYERIVAWLRELDAAVSDDLIQSRDPNDVLRAQGASRLMKTLLRDLAP